MKVLHISEIVQGGVSSYLNEIIPAQCSMFGIDNVRVLVAEDETKFLTEIDKDIIRTAGPRERNLKTLFQLFMRARLLIKSDRPDIVHLHSSFAGAVIRLGMWLLPGHRPKIVYCAHGWAFNMDIPAPLRIAYQCVERLLAMLTDAIVCISEFEYQEARRRGFSAKLLHRIRNGIAPNAATPDIAIMVDNRSRLNLLFVGRQDRQKGFDVLVDAMRLLQGEAITLHVVGEPVVSHADVAVDLPNIVYHGWQSREAVAAYMSAVDVLVVPSRWEGFGLVAIEAMRQGLPVCASTVDALPESVREDVSGHLFPSGNSVALAALLARLDRETLGLLGTSARQWFLANFTANRMNRALIDLYQELCPEIRSGPVSEIPEARQAEHQTPPFTALISHTSPDGQ